MSKTRNIADQGTPATTGEMQGGTETDLKGMAPANVKEAINSLASGGITSATTDVITSSATAPTSGQVLTATGATAATWQDAGGPGVQQISLRDTNGYGSTNTAILRYSLTDADDGSDMTLTQSAVNGDSVTINTAGIYSCYIRGMTNTRYFGISLNSTQLTTSINGITDADRIAITQVFNGGYIFSDSVTLYLEAEDVIRPHGDAGAWGAGTNEAFRITRVG